MTGNPLLRSDGIAEIRAVPHHPRQADEKEAEAMTTLGELEALLNRAKQTDANGVGNWSAKMVFNAAIHEAAPSLIAAAREAERLREALGDISRMKLFPDNAINQMTLLSAIRVARAALDELETQT